MSYETVMKGQKYGMDWQPDVSTDCCMLCKSSFSLTLRRHHCRVRSLAQLQPARGCPLCPC
jgi:hypothetical protein